jgi:hypothetical protein
MFKLGFIISNCQNMVKIEKSGRYTQVNKTILARFRWSLFRSSFSTKIAWAGFRVVVVDRWSLFGGGR